MIKKMRKMFGNESGFTLLEILVVLMIMGFLLAMVAPKLSGIFQDSEDTICDTNIKDSKKYVAFFEAHSSKLPDDMIVPAYYDGVAWYGPTEESTTADGNEVFTTAILERLRLMPHRLRADEVKEIVNDLGIRSVVVLNNPDDASVAKVTAYGGAAVTPTASSQFRSVDLTGTDAVGMIWPMIGGGHVAVTGWAHHADWDAVDNTIADPEWAYRLILGIGPDCELMHSIISAEGQCPSFERAAADDTMWGWYVVVLPRLAATVAHLETDGSASGTMMREATCYAGDDPADVKAQRKTFDLSYVNEEYERAAFDVFCPEGHRYPEVVEFWGIEGSETFPTP